MIIGMPRDTSAFPQRVYMEEIQRELSVHRSTVITWEVKGWLPDGLKFHRDENNWRYWDRKQLPAAHEWHNRPGKRRAPRSTKAA